MGNAQCGSCIGMLNYFKIKTVRQGEGGDQEGLRTLKRGQVKNQNNINSPRSVGDVITETENNVFGPCINTHTPNLKELCNSNLVPNTGTNQPRGF